MSMRERNTIEIPVDDMDKKGLLFTALLQLGLGSSALADTLSAKAIGQALKINNTQIQVHPGYYARILRGKSQVDFQTMTHDLNRKIVFYIDGQGIESLVGLSDSSRLLKIGFPADYVKKKLAEGFGFKMVVFKGGDLVKPATWDSVVGLVDYVYGGNSELYSSIQDLKTVELLKGQLPALKNAYEPVAQGQALAQDVYSQIEASGGKLWEARLFLHQALNLNENFSGDGFTRLDDGSIGVAEYISPNVEIEKLDEYFLFDLSL